MERLTETELIWMLEAELGSVPISIRDEYQNGDRDQAARSIAILLVSRLSICEIFHRPPDLERRTGAHFAKLRDARRSDYSGKG